MCACLPPLRALVLRISSRNHTGYGSRRPTGYEQNTAGSWRSHGNRHHLHTGGTARSGTYSGKHGGSSKATASASEEEIIGLKDIRATATESRPSMDAHSNGRTWLSDLEGTSPGDHKELEAGLARNSGGWPAQQQHHDMHAAPAPRMPRAAVTRGTVSTAQGPLTNHNQYRDMYGVEDSRPYTPLERPRSNSFGTLDKLVPEGNEILVSTRVRQTVD
jgi:hypothetical protein